jgi:hypothetical protein
MHISAVMLGTLRTQMPSLEWAFKLKYVRQTHGAPNERFKGQSICKVQYTDHVYFVSEPQCSMYPFACFTILYYLLSYVVSNGMFQHISLIG